MNICLLFACMIVLPVIAGRGVFAVLYRKQAEKFHMADHLIVGWLVAIGLAEVAHLVAVFLGWRFSGIIRLWALAFVAVVCTGVIILFVNWKIAHKKNNEKKCRGKYNSIADGGSVVTPVRFGMILILMLLVVWQIVTIMSQGTVYRTGDMTVETVESFLKTDMVYAVNPLTGRAYESGIPLRIRILCLPTLYGALCSLFGLEGVMLVWKYIPLVVLFMSYGAFWLIGKTLFDGEKERDKRLLFLVLVALVFCVGDYAYGMDGFGLLHCGFQGVTIRNMVLVPYAFVLALRHKWRPAFALVLAEACITWTLYGLGVCLVVFLGMAAISLWKRRTAAGFHSMREEA